MADASGSTPEDNIYGEHLPPVVRDLSVVGTYAGRCVFLTGATGFVGKVVLEKLLRSCPDTKRIFVLVRPRKGQTPDARMREEILGSEIFATLRKQRSDFDEFCREKLVAVAGELTQVHVGISEQDRAMLYEHVNIIIHCAAVVDFNERLDRAIELNAMGSLRMLEIGKQCKALGAFLHVSTCYTNSNRANGLIEEKCYPLGFDVEEMIAKVKSMPPSELENIATTGLLHSWPNTYTMTKAMTEQLLIKHRGDIPLVILRPSIVGSAWSEPTPGWVDVISAAGAVYVAVGMGVIKFLPGSPLNIGDVIPVDYVSNAIIASVPAVFERRGKYFICHAASSSENPMAWEKPLQVVTHVFKKHPPPRAVGPANFRFVPSPQAYQLRFLLDYSLPASILKTLALVGTDAYKAKAQQFEKLLWQVRVLIEAFKHFVENQWTFDNRNVRSIYQMIRPEERAMFELDLTNLDWVRYSELFCFGLLRYTMKSPLLPIKQRDMKHFSVSHDILNPFRHTLSYKVMPDVDIVRRALAERLEKAIYPKARESSEYARLMLEAPEVLAAMEAEAAHLAKTLPKKKQRVPPAEMVAARAQSIIKNMFAEPSNNVVSAMGWFFRKVWRRVYEGVFVARQYVSEVTDAAKSGPIVYLPTHRSYIDFLLVSYVAFLMQLPIPFIAAGEDFLGILAVRWLFRKSGAFFMRRSFAQDKLYSVIMQKYLELLLADGQSLEFYIEGTRSRSGKFLQPKLGLLTMVNAAVEKGVVSDVTMVPVTINYEKIMEGNMYANELSGERKIKESLSSLIRARQVLNSNFGHTTVVFGKPFSLVGWTAEHKARMSEPETVARLSRAIAAQPSAALPSTVAVSGSAVTAAGAELQSSKYRMRALGHHILHELALNIETMPIHIAAALMLQYRHGITAAQLQAKLAWVATELELRGGSLFGFEMESHETLMKQAVGYLGDVLRNQNRNVFEPAISSRGEYNNMLVLGQYKNRLVHYFYREALWCVVIYALSRGKHGAEAECTVDASAALADVAFLHALLQSEFVIKENPDEPEDHVATLRLMAQHGIVTLSGGDAADSDLSGLRVTVASTGEAHFSFMCSLLWPFLDSFYSASMMLYTLQPTRSIARDLLVTQTQWLATTLYHESMLSFFEACSKETLDNAFSTLRQLGVVRHTAKDAKGKNVALKGGDASGVALELCPAFQAEDALEGLIGRISAMRKQPPVVKAGSRRNLVADIPILAKINNPMSLNAKF